MLVLAAVLLVAGVTVFVLAPFWTRQAAPLADGSDAVARLRELYALRDVSYETIRDLEFDFHAGKIGEADYTELAAKYKLEAAGLLARIDVLEAALSPAAERRPEKK